MQYLVVSDVFGRTNALLDMVNQFEGSVDIFDPYGLQQIQFEDEAEAYHFFISNVGFETYVENLQQKVLSYSEDLYLIGFSVGASAIWKMSANNDLNHIERAICFYGSQIRFYTNLKVNFPIQLILPSHEKHFSISELISEISDITNVKIIKTSYEHGFMNRLSENYDQAGYDKYIGLIIESCKK